MTKSPSRPSAAKSVKAPAGAPELFLLTAILFTGFGAHNFLQERIMALPGWHWGSMLGLLEALGLLLCTGCERIVFGELSSRRAPWKSFVLLASCVACSAMLSNIALDFINYPVKVVFRSSKVIPTMLVGTVLRGRQYSRAEYYAAAILTAGLVTFGFADFSVSPQFSVFGILLVALSVCADAFTPNVQEEIMARYGSTRREVVFHCNVLSVAFMLATTAAKGDLLPACAYLGRVSTSELAVFIVYMLCAYIAISAWVQIILRFDSVLAVIIASVRKALTLLLSFALFPKPFSVWYVVGAALVFGGLVATAQARRDGTAQGRMRKAISLGAILPTAASNSIRTGSDRC